MNWRATALFCLLLLSPAVMRAQSPPADLAAQKGALPKKALDIFKKPLHPVIKSVAPRGGFGPGIGYKSPSTMNDRLFASTEAVITWRKYWSTQASATFQGHRLRLDGYARAREMTRLDFYGIGTNTGRDDRTTFSFLDRSAGGIASVRVARIFAVGGRLEQLWPHIERGRNHDFPSIEQRFDETSARGLVQQPNFISFTGLFNVNYPGGTDLRRHGVDVHVEHSEFKDRGNGQYDFGRTNIESQQRIPGFRPSQRLTLHQFLSTTNTEPDKRVPFYLQYTLGGNGAVRAFNEEFLGTDLSKATLRGFSDLRFRGPHMLLLQAEYRIRLDGTPVDATVFVDAGKVTARRSDLDLTSLKTDYGFSVSVMSRDATAVRIDVGLGGGEGTRIFLSVGSIFQPQ